MAALKGIGWVVVNTLQALWLGAFSFFCFFVVMTIYAITWNPEASLSTARVFYGPINVFLGLSTLVVEGQENIPRDRPYILMMNHQSIADIMIAWMITPVPVRFIAKNALNYVPVIGWVMWIFGMVSIDRSDAHKAARALKKAARVLAGGRTLCAFPEGTRTRTGKIGPFKKGVFLLAMKARVPIVPVAAEGLNVFAPRTRWNPRPVTIRVKIGAPIVTDDQLGRDELIQKVRDTIVAMNLEIGGPGGEELALASPEAHAA
ncbi:MAG TPA: lysophospholipid acyltransferase family protein [Myxococcota bacterium]